MCSVFFGAHSDCESEKTTLGLLGIPLQGVGNSRTGAKEGPDAIRCASHVLETYVPRYDQDFLTLEACDFGNTKAKDWNSLSLELEQTVAQLKNWCFLGGDHTLSYYTCMAMAKAHPGLRVIILDAHLDAFDCYGGSPMAHATWVRRVGEELGDRRIAHLGGRAYTQEERAWFMHHQRLIPLHTMSLTQGVSLLLPELQNVPVFVSVDIDVLDPGIAPGVGNPESLGATYRDLMGALELLGQCPIVGWDVVEVIPDLDPNQQTAIVAAEIVRDGCLCLFGEP